MISCKAANVVCCRCESMGILETVLNIQFYQREAEYPLIKIKNVKAFQLWSTQNVSLSGEKGGMTTRSCRHWLVVESKILYVNQKE